MAKKKAMVAKKLTQAQFLQEVNQIAPSQYGEFKGTKTKVQSIRRIAWKHIKENKLKLSCYVVSNEGSKQSLYIVGQ